MTLAITSELEGLSLGNKRLEQRARFIMERLAGDPTAHFPKVFAEPKELEGFYRFLENPSFSGERLLEPHVGAVIERARAAGKVLLIHDTTDFTFEGERHGLGRTVSAKSQGFMGHFTFATAALDNKPLGVLRLQTWVRTGATRTSALKSGSAPSKARELPSEHERWRAGIEQTSALLADSDVQITHVADSEADNYGLLAAIVAGGRDEFVIRGCHDRNVESGDQLSKLRQVVGATEVLAERTIEISARKIKMRATDEKRAQPRGERTARVQMQASRVRLQRPASCGNSLPKAIEVNVVYVSELDPPPDCEPVEWILLTSKAISNAAEVLHVVDQYCFRWIVEEYFKSLKTGCRYETRQLESYQTLLKALVLFVPVAWLMLHLRYESRRDDQPTAESVLPDLELQVLRQSTGKAINSARDALLAVAALGGHIKNNGAPGWLVLWRGFHELCAMVRGFAIAKRAINTMNSPSTA